MNKKYLIFTLTSLLFTIANSDKAYAIERENSSSELDQAVVKQNREKAATNTSSQGNLASVPLTITAATQTDTTNTANRFLSSLSKNSPSNSGDNFGRSSEFRSSRTSSPSNNRKDYRFQEVAHAGGLKLATILARDVTKNSDNKWIKFSGEFVDETASNNLGSNLLLFVSNKEASEAEILILSAIVEGGSHALSKIKCIENFNKKYDQFFKDRQLEKVGYYGKVGAKSIATVVASFGIDSAKRKIEHMKSSY